MNVPVPIQTLVAEALQNVPRPFPTDVTDRVFLEIEARTYLMSRYRIFCRESDQATVNRQIGLEVKEETTGVNRGERCRTPRSRLIESYTPH